MSIGEQVHQGCLLLAPMEFWNSLQLIIGLLVFIMTFIQLKYDPAFSFDHSIITIISRGFLILQGLGGLWAAADALSGPEYPRSLLLWVMVTTLCIQIRVVTKFRMLHFHVT